MNGTNRVLIVLAAGMAIIVMAAVIFLTWAAPEDSISALQDVVQFLDDNQTTAGKLIVTLSALVIAVLALLIIILEMAPEDEVKDLRIEQAGATTIVPAEALRMRLEEALAALPEVDAATARVSAKDRGIETAVDITISRAVNVAHVTQEATRVVVDTIQTDLGLPVAGVPTVRIVFGEGSGEPQPVASSMTSPPAPDRPAGPAPGAPPAPPAGTDEAPADPLPGDQRPDTPAPPKEPQRPPWTRPPDDDLPDNPNQS